MCFNMFVYGGILVLSVLTSIQVTIPLHSGTAFPPVVECFADSSTVGYLV